MFLALPLLSAGCGGSSSPTSTTEASGALGFSHCMRARGVPNFPDPASGGHIPKLTLEQLGVSSARLQAAQAACQHLFPNGPGSEPTQAALRQSWSDFRNFAHCMRSRGVATWPDPTRYPPHPERPVFDLQTAGIDPNAPQLAPDIRDCLPLLHGNNPQRLGEGGS